MANKEFTNINGINVVDQTARDNIPTKTSQLTNDSNYATNSEVDTKIANAQLGGGEVDLSGYVTKETGNASQITFADGQTFQAKLEAGALKGDKGDTGEQGPAGANGQDGLTTSISVNGNTYTHVDGVITLPNYTNSGTRSGVFAMCKKWNVLGDSITFGLNTTTTYHEILKNKYSIPTVTKYAVSGSQISTGGTNSATSSDNSFCNRYTNMNDDADLVTVFGGINDLLHKVPLGTMDDTDGTTFYGALKILCEGLINKYPNSKIIFFTPLKAAYGSNGLDTNGYNGLNLNLEDYIQVMKKVCNYYCIPIIDLSNICRLQPNLASIKTNYMPDGLHPNAAGHRYIADTLELATNSYIIASSGTEEDTNIAVTGVTLSETTKAINLNDSFTLTATIQPANATTQNVTWSTDNSNVTLTSNGLSCRVQGAKEGTSIITVTTKDGNKVATCNVTIAASSETTSYSISYNLGNSTSSNSVSSITANSSYTTTITANNSYQINSITVTMGGIDISTTAVSSNVITIAEVTGDIVITVSTSAISSSSDDAIISIDATNTISGKTLTNNGTGATTYDGTIVTREGGSVTNGTEGIDITKACIQIPPWDISQSWTLEMVVNGISTDDIDTAETNAAATLFEGLIGKLWYWNADTKWEFNGVGFKNEYGYNQNKSLSGTIDSINNKTIKMIYDAGTSYSLYLGDTLLGSTTRSSFSTSTVKFTIGKYNSSQDVDSFTLKSFKVYDYAKNE